MNHQGIKHWTMDRLGVMVDMAGCPNRCRHCWLGSHKNGHMTTDDFRDIAAQFQSWRDESGDGIRELSFFSWWREPDYRDDYRELWALEQELSSPGAAKRFELLSTWRLAHDEAYARWAATLGPKACQITFFGLEENTDWFMRRKGGFQGQLAATERVLEAGIAPRWQLFLTKRCLGELEAFMELIRGMKLYERCAERGMKFELFINSISPEGNGYEVENLRLEEEDLAGIPDELIAISRDGLDALGKPERALIDELMHDDGPVKLDANMHALAIDADYDVYPNLAEPTPWWRLGNLRRDGVDAILRAYRDGTPPAMRANRALPRSELAVRYGDPTGRRLYPKSDLLARWMHQWGAE